MNAKGYLKLCRSVRHTQWYRQPEAKNLMLHLLLRAYHTPTQDGLGEGQLLAHTDELAFEAGLRKKRLREALSVLRRQGELTVQPAEGGHNITLRHYRRYIDAGCPQTIGHARIHRSLLRWAWYRNAAARALLIHLILRANYTPCKQGARRFERGQLLSSRAELAEETGLSEKQVRNAIQRLSDAGTITLQTSNRGTLITVVKYAHYQDGTLAEEASEKTSPGEKKAGPKVGPFAAIQSAAEAQERASQRPLVKKNKKNKNKYNGGEGSISISIAGPEGYFECAWTAPPHFFSGGFLPTHPEKPLIVKNKALALLALCANPALTGGRRAALPAAQSVRSTLHAAPMKTPTKPKDRRKTLEESKAPFFPPSGEEIRAHFAHRLREKIDEGHHLAFWRAVNAQAESELFENHYQANGWRVGRVRIKSWRHAVNSWLLRSLKWHQDERHKLIYGKKTSYGDPARYGNHTEEEMNKKLDEMVTIHGFTRLSDALKD